MIVDISLEFLVEVVYFSKYCRSTCFLELIQPIETTREQYFVHFPPAEGLFSQPKSPARL